MMMMCGSATENTRIQQVFLPTERESFGTIGGLEKTTNNNKNKFNVHY